MDADDVGEAAAFCRSLLLGNPGMASVRVDLAQSLLMEGDFAGAAAEASAAVALEPGLARGWVVRGTARKAQHDPAGAAADFEVAVAAAPERTILLVHLATCYADAGRLDEAETVLRRAVAVVPECRAAHGHLAALLLKQDRLAELDRPRTGEVARDARPGEARTLSGGVIGNDLLAAKARHRVEDWRRQVYITPAARPTRTLLVLAAEAGNVPLQHLISRQTTTEVRWFFEHAPMGQEATLPSADLVFNAIGDPDVAPAMPPHVAGVLRRYAGRVLNHPDQVARTRRSDLPDLLSGLPGVVVPKTVRHHGGGGLATRLAVAGIEVPVLVRPIGSHGGAGLMLCRDAAALAGLADMACYVTQFVDFISDDGWYRKFRAIFVDGEPHLYHLAIARQWLVHYWSAGMAEDPARREEERRFLANPETALGAAGMAALRMIGLRLGLDYGGIDFGVLPDGRLVVFEANATMLVHPEKEASFAYRNAAVRAIQQAFEGMLERTEAVIISVPTG